MKLIYPFVFAVLLASAPIAAQQSGGTVDPISGTWKGDMAPKGAPNRTAITLDLKSDGKGGVSGALLGLPIPGEIKTGTFDPRTGALKLAVAKKGESETGLVLEGNLVEGTIAGVVRGDNQVGDFKVTRIRGDSSAGAQSGATDAAVALRGSFSELSGWVTKAADLVPPEKYSYRPTESVRTFGQLIAHIADGQNYFCGRARRPDTQWSDAVEKGPTDKAALVQKLKASIEACNAAYASDADVRGLISNLGHTSLHYGNIITYMRMLGLTPPSS